MKMAYMNQKRRGISNSSVILNNRIWVCGGLDEKGSNLKSVEMYDPLTNKWKYMKQMNESQWSAAAVVVNGKIFCSGGRNEKVLDSVECYDPSSDVWTLMSNMPKKIWEHCAAEINGRLIVMGGYADTLLNSVWALDITDKNAVWIEKPSMSIPRRDFSIAKIHGKIFICGGWSEQKLIDSVEIFDGEVWRVGSKMPTSPFGFSAVVIPISFAIHLN